VLDKILGVSPPQKGLAQDLKAATKDQLQPDFKKDFERQLQRKMDDKKSTNTSKDIKQDPKALRAKKTEDELRAERNEKKPSGGTKKKMVTESEDKMISNVMALPKSEFEVPDQKIDLAMIETDGISEENKSTAVGQDVFSAAASTDSTAISDGQLMDKSRISEQTIQSEMSDLMLALEQQQMAPVDSAISGETSQAIPSVASENEVSAINPKILSAQEQLSQDVGFQSDLNQHIAQAGLVQKMKDFESIKGMSQETAQSFEQKVLEQLSQDKAFTVPSSELSQQSSSEQQSDTMKDTVQEFKADGFKNESQLYVGQSHTDFRAHLASPLDKVGSPTPMSQLLENREENVQEVMRQAQFLATKGGGEMTVKMSPDGMGEIQLKVLMNDGRLNIEMQTQDKSVKKLIEDSLTELKSGLAAQQLSVDHVRISTVNGTNTDNTAQFQNNQGHGQNFGQAQDQQKEFWKQFQNNFGNQARRGSYGDVQAVGSRASAEPNAMQPMKSGAARAAGRTGSTLNKVA